MGTKIKGIYKGFKYVCNPFTSHLKEREIEIGHPTDVKHVAHIGWDDSSGSGPTWMNQFTTGPDFATTSIGNSGSALSPWSSQDFGKSQRRQPAATTMLSTEIPNPDIPSIPKKRKKKKKSTSTPSTSPRSSRPTRPKAKHVEVI